jgi:uncharacterized Zn-binding protein involved in type VI secretion
LGKPAAKKGDDVVGIDTHIVLVPAPPAPPIPTPLPHPFRGPLKDKLCKTVFADDKPCATKGSKALNKPHVPSGGPSFQTPPKDEGTVKAGSSTVFMEDKAAARHGDIVETCNDPVDAPMGRIIAVSTVIVD